MRVLFLGNHTVGVESLKVLQTGVEVVGVIAHPIDPEDGVRYESVFEYAKRNNLDVMRGKAKDISIFNFAVQKKPDLIFVADYRYLLPIEFIQLANLGAVNLHPSLLPKYRGRASINWAIIQGERQLGLTAHFIDEGMDTGDIIAQLKFELSSNEDVGDALQKLYPLYAKITRQVIEDFQKGTVFRIQQNHQAATVYPKRTPQDGLINWQHAAKDILNLIRAVAAPYPGAFTYLGNEKIIIWHASLDDVNQKKLTVSGTIIKENNQIKVQCQDHCLVLNLLEYDSQKVELISDLIFG